LYGSQAEYAGSIPVTRSDLDRALSPELFKKRMKRQRGRVPVRHCPIGDLHGFAAERDGLVGPA
jgi:hypothetical protein